MKNAPDKVAGKIKTHTLFSAIFFFENRAVNVENYATARQAIDGNIIRCTRFARWITKAINTLRICNTYCPSTARVVTRTCLPSNGDQYGYLHKDNTKKTCWCIKHASALSWFFYFEIKVEFPKPSHKRNKAANCSASLLEQRGRLDPHKLGAAKEFPFPDQRVAFLSSPTNLTGCGNHRIS
jgi:hypothetical protein